MTANPDLSRIQKAKDDRRKQLQRWEQYDQKCEEIRNGRKISNKKSIDFQTDIIFLEAAARGDLEEVKLLFESGINPDVRNEDGMTALHQCCIDNHIEMFKLLLKNNADVNATDNEHWTPLHAAATCGHKEICGMLIDNNADLLAMNVDGNMPYDLCDDDDTLILVESEMSKRNITQSQIDEIRLRPEREMLDDVMKRSSEKENLNALDFQGAAPLHIACACGYLEVARYLLQSNVNVHLPDKDGWLPIHIAVCWSQIEIIELLVSYGADMESTTRSGQSVDIICDSKELRLRLKEIWDRRNELRVASKVNQIGFQRARGSSRRRSSTNVMRSSMREKRNLSRMEAAREKQLGEQVEAKIIAEQKNSGNTEDPLPVESPPPPNVRVGQTDPRNPPISLLQVKTLKQPDNAKEEQPSKPTATPPRDTALKPPLNPTFVDIKIPVVPAVPRRKNGNRAALIHSYSQESPTTSSFSSSPASSPSTSSDSVTPLPKSSVNKTPMLQVMAKSPQGHLVLLETNSLSSNDSKPPLMAVPSRDFRNRVSRDTPQPVRSPDSLPPSVQPRNPKNISRGNSNMIRVGPQAPKVYSSSDPIPSEKPGMYAVDPQFIYNNESNSSFLSASTMNLEEGSRRKIFKCCYTM